MAGERILDGLTAEQRTGNKKVTNDDVRAAVRAGAEQLKGKLEVLTVSSTTRTIVLDDEAA